MELNTLYVKKLTMNRAWITFDSLEKALKWDKFLDDQHVCRTRSVEQKEGKTYYGFKMFRCRYQIPRMILESRKEEECSI